MTDEPNVRETLWDRYRTAFSEWASQVNLLRQTQEAPESNAFADAHRRTNAAEATYRESRERLTDGMVNARANAVSGERELGSMLQNAD